MKMDTQGKRGAKKIATLANNSMGLFFFNPMSQLKHTDVIGFCMQLGNSEDR